MDVDSNLDFSRSDIQVEVSHESRVLSRSLPASRGEQAYLKGGNSSFFTETAKNHQVSIYVEEERSVNISGDYRNVNTCYDYLRGRLLSYTSRPLPKKGKAIEKKSTDKLKNINCRFQFKPDGCKVPTCPFKHIASKKKSQKKKLLKFLINQKLLLVHQNLCLNQKKIL